MPQRVSKCRLKARALEYFREVERTGNELIVTDRGKPVLKIVPYRADPDRALLELRESVVRDESPLEPVGIEDWRALE